MPQLSSLSRFLRLQFNLQKEEAAELTYAEIVEGIPLRGYNLWILSMAMIIATIGLITNSQSAIIGAMLISPLMGPVIGFAFGMAVKEPALKWRAIRSWLMMTVISLISSAVFFLLSPFDDNTPALASFNKATIFDIGLAFFGGMAGFVGILKREGVKILAGVAVATACMPPLCTAAWGAVHLNAACFFGGLYFYSINCLFIGLGTYVMARYTGYNGRTPVGRQRTTYSIAWQLLIVAMMLPGGWIAWQKWQQQHATERATSAMGEAGRVDALERKVAELDSVVRSYRAAGQ